MKTNDFLLFLLMQQVATMGHQIILSTT